MPDRIRATVVARFTAEQLAELRATELQETVAASLRTELVEAGCAQVVELTYRWREGGTVLEGHGWGRRVPTPAPAPEDEPAWRWQHRGVETITTTAEELAAADELRAGLTALGLALP